MSDDVVVAFTSRLGGVSTGKYATANLSTRVGDDPAAVRENRRLALASHGLSGVAVMTTRQEHTARVVRIGSADLQAGESVSLDITADGMVTTEPNMVLLVGAADCLPIVLVHPGRAVAVLHAGWRGLMAGIIETGVDQIRDAGANPDETIAFLGPAIRACCYTVDAGLRDTVGARYHSAPAVTRHGAPAINLAAAARIALAQRGIVEVLDDGRCTFDDASFFSRRRDGHTGCQGALVLMR